MERVTSKCMPSFLTLKETKLTMVLKLLYKEGLLQFL